MPVKGFITLGSWPGWGGGAAHHPLPQPLNELIRVGITDGTL